MVVEGSTSSSKCNKKSVEHVAASDIKADDKSSTVTGESEPEKLGVSVPTKKQRIMDRSVSPSKRSDESLTEKPDHSRAVTVIEKSSVNEITEKNNEGLKNLRLHWDLNLPVEAWGQPSDIIDGIKADEAAAENELEDGELQEPNDWGDYKGEAEHVDYGSELEESDKGILAKTKVGDASRIREANEGNDSEKHVVVNMSDPHSKGSSSSSSSRSFGSKPFRVPSHDIIQRRRPDNYELSSGQAWRDDRSRMRMNNMNHGRGYSRSWDSKRRFSPPNYNRGSFGFERARPQNMEHGRGMMINYDQSGSRHGARPYGRGEEPYGRGAGSNGRGARPYGHAPRRHFSDGGYKGQFRKFSDGGDHDFKGPHDDTNQFRGRMNNQMSASKRGRGNSSFFKRMNYHHSESRSRSYSPVSWNGRSRSSPAPPSGFREEERFLADQEMSFMSPPRNRMSTPRGKNYYDAGENHNNSFSERKSRLGQRFDVGNSMERPNSDNNCSRHLRSFTGNRRFKDDPEENTGFNRFMLAQQQRTRRFEAILENGGDDIMGFRFNREHAVVVAGDNNNNMDNKDNNMDNNDMDNKDNNMDNNDMDNIDNKES